jgi:hypothetical protein
MFKLPLLESLSPLRILHGHGGDPRLVTVYSGKGRLGQFILMMSQVQAWMLLE